MSNNKTERMTKETQKAIDDFIGERPDVTADELVEFIKDICPRPDIEALESKHYRNIANYIMRRKRDKDGLRTFLSNGDRKCKYINIEKTDNVHDIRAVIKCQNKQIDTMGRNIIKAKRREEVLEGQMSIDELHQVNNISQQ